ncbi:MAG TPA: hypothetical protein VGQ89_07785 [Candidatus Limnocylindrales bacterium]|nr:hypothetical protein [Candidatus Limnocylindrales bacterium]
MNDDDVSHDPVGNGWSISLLGYYESASVRFSRAGTYRYHCSIHPTMRGTICVLGTGGGAITPDTDLETVHVREGGVWPAQVLAVLGMVMLAGTSVLDRLRRRRSAART